MIESPPLSRSERNARALEVPESAMALGRRAALGGAIALSAQITRLVLQIGGTAILSRLLAPADYGLFAMASTLTMFLGVFTDLGLTTATIQRPHITQKMVSTLFAVTVGAGVVLALLAIAATPIAAWFYDQPQILGLLPVLALAFPLTALGAQHNALLARQMRWRTLQLVPTMAQIAGLAAAILIALATQWGPWAFVAQTLVSAATATLYAWIAVDWRPSRPLALADARSELAFGGYVTGNMLLSFFERQLDNVLIGARWGAVELAFYSRAYSLLVMPILMINIAVSSAAVPALSRLSHNPVQWNTLFLKASTGTSFIAIGAASMLLANANAVVMLLLGPGWEPVIQIFEILSLSSAVAIAGNNCNWAFLSLGKARAYFHWALMAAPPQILSFFIGLPWGAVGVATAYTVAASLILPCYFWYTSRHAPVSVQQFFHWLLPVFVTAAISVLAGREIATLIMDMPVWARFLIGTTATGLIYLTIGIGMVMGLARYRGARDDLMSLVMALARRLRTRPA